MEDIIIESRLNRKTVYKTDSGIEIRPMLHSKQIGSGNSTNITYHYILYSTKKSSNGYDIYTNPELYNGELKTIESFDTREEAEKAAYAVNQSIRFLFENIK